MIDHGLFMKKLKKYRIKGIFMAKKVTLTDTQYARDKNGFVLPILGLTQLHCCHVSSIGKMLQTTANNIQSLSKQ